MATLPKKNKTENGQTLTDNYGQIYTYKGILNQWVNTGADYDTTPVSFFADGIVTPEIVQTLISVEDAKSAGQLTGSKILPNPDAYWYLLKGQSFIDVSPEGNNVRIDIAQNRLIYHLHTRNYCRGAKGAIGEQGEAGTNGSPGPKEVTNTPLYNGLSLDIEKLVPTPLDTPIVIRMFIGSVQWIEIRYNLDGTKSFTYKDENVHSIDEQTSVITHDGTILVAHLFRSDGEAWEPAWSYKARQAGPRGDKGQDGTGFIEIKNSTVDDVQIRFGRAIRAIRNNSRYDLYTITASLTTEMPVSHLRINSDDSQIDYSSTINVIDADQPDYWISVEPTSDSAKGIFRWAFVGDATSTLSLDLPHWTPFKVCGYGGWTGFEKAEEIPCCQEDLFLCEDTLQQFECPFNAGDPDGTDPTVPEPEDPCALLGDFNFTVPNVAEPLGGGTTYIHESVVGILNARFLDDDNVLVFDGRSDDVVVMIGATDSIIVTGSPLNGATFTLPINHVLWRDTDGFMVNGDAVSKTFRTGVGGAEYSYFVSPSNYGTGHVIDLEAGGFETREWTTGITIGELRARGWIDDNGILRFKFVHIVSGLGFVTINNVTCG